MNCRLLMPACAALLLCLATAATQASDSKPVSPSTLSASAAWLRPMPPGARVGAGYLRIQNSGATARRLLGADTARASSVEIHTMVEVDGVMRMRRLPDGIEIAAGAQIALKPGADHLMFFNPDPPFAPGEQIAVRLSFDADELIELQFEVADRSGR